MRGSSICAQFGSDLGPKIWSDNQTRTVQYFEIRRPSCGLTLYVVPKVHKVYRVEEVEEEKKEEKPEAKSRPKLEEFIIKPIESNARSAMMPVRV